MELHVCREARRRYRLEEFPLSPTGSLTFEEFRAARLIAARLNEIRRQAGEPPVRAAQINAIGLINEIFHYLAGLYRESRRPGVLAEAVGWLQERLGPRRLDEALRGFVEEFPPGPVLRGEMSPEAFVDGNATGGSNRHLLLEELLVFWLANWNPAFSPCRDLFDDSSLQGRSSYEQIPSALGEFFRTRPRFGPQDQTLVEMLRSPAIAEPESLSGQLRFIWERWGYLLSRFGFLHRLLGGLDLIREEENIRFLGPGLAEVYDFSGLGREQEHYSPDRDWMPRLVLMAKNLTVWLDQLSRKHRRHIWRLDQVPDEELDMLAGWGISGLWLIGVWQRSGASREIKRLRGSPDAFASAYSLHDYEIASDLGGEQAYRDLRDRAWARGIRLASDMVPNHMGIDSRWVIQHPERFLSLDHSPFPSYTFQGPDLCRDERIGVHLEDHYYDHTDAAVVFKRVDRSPGACRYVYHGNDGTSTPWNDTAQLDYLNPETREAVIRTILHVAGLFPIIRFDAAMTLTKKHYQRLWFPEPGTGGAIPSRAEHGMTREMFDALMPEEFWREVVDRVAREAPDTLLLAEAFWMMEGYFVRTLGMHRVYNSAFMNMLRDEENAKYRSVIKNTLEFDPEILKRYVNFMNNPDERSAVDQFGKGDKYFGVCTLLATLPGLPMFGHGQIEGFAEKYGMEFRRSLRDEQPDRDLIAGHEREIFPLLHRRHLFAGSNDFLLFDFFTGDGRVNEDVFAYSNRCGHERTLVIYHNRFASTAGWIRASSTMAVKGSRGQKSLVQRSLGEGLRISPEEGSYVTFRDQLGGLEYIRAGRAIHEQGLYLELHAYERHVFLDFRDIRDGEGRHYARLSSHLGMNGVPSVDAALRELILKEIQEPFERLASAELLRRLAEARERAPAPGSREGLLEEVEQSALRMAGEIQRFAGVSGDAGRLAREIRRKVAGVLDLGALDRVFPAPRSRKYHAAAAFLSAGLESQPGRWASLLGWALVHALGKASADPGFERRGRRWVEDWKLSTILERALAGMGPDEEEARREASAAAAIFTTHQRWFEAPTPAAPRRTGRPGAARRPRVRGAVAVLRDLIADEEVRRFLQFNRFQEVLWFNKEALESLLWWMLAVAAVDALADAAGTADAAAASGPTAEASDVPRLIAARFEVVDAIRKAEERSGYHVEALLREVERRSRSPRPSPVS